MKGSSIRRLLITALMAAAGLGLTIGFVSFQLQVGHITIIIGDKNKVENGDQSQTVIQPVKPVRAETSSIERPVPEVTSPPEPQIQPAPKSHHPVVYYEEAEEEEYEDEDCVCVCPDDEEDPDEEEAPEEEDPRVESVFLSY